MNCTLGGFKPFSLSNDDYELIGTYCEHLAKKLDINENELGDYIVENIGTFYCGDSNFVDRFGFLSNEDFDADVKGLSDDLGIDTETAIGFVLDSSETANGSGKNNACDWFTGAIILFTNFTLAENKYMADQFEISLHNAGVNQTQFCKLVGVTRQAVHKWKISGRYPEWVKFSLVGISLESSKK